MIKMRHNIDKATSEIARIQRTHPMLLPILTSKYIEAVAFLRPVARHSYSPLSACVGRSMYKWVSFTFV